MAILQPPSFPGFFFPVASPSPRCRHRKCDIRAAPPLPWRDLRFRGRRVHTGKRGTWERLGGRYTVYKVIQIQVSWRKKSFLSSENGKKWKVVLLWLLQNMELFFVHGGFIKGYYAIPTGWFKVIPLKLVKVGVSTNFSEIRVTCFLLHNKYTGQFKQGVPPRLQEIEPTIWLFVWIWKATSEFSIVDIGENTWMQKKQVKQNIFTKCCRMVICRCWSSIS